MKRELPTSGVSSILWCDWRSPAQPRQGPSPTSLAAVPQSARDHWKGGTLRRTSSAPPLEQHRAPPELLNIPATAEHLLVQPTVLHPRAHLRVPTDDIILELQRGSVYVWKDSLHLR
jgi:hypothetical protein